MIIRICIFLVFFQLHSLFALTSDESKEKINILSLNTMLLPKPASFSHQSNRAKQLADILKNYPADIIALEEVFINSLRNKLQKYLLESFPYQYHLGKSQVDGISFLSSGLVLLSKHPFTLLEALHFKNYNKLSFDRFSSKGSIFVEFQLPKNKKFQLAITHLQAGGSKKNAELRLQQLNEIYQMQLRHRRHNIAQAIIGDININGHNQDQMNEVKEIFSVEQFKLDGDLQYTFGHKTQCFNPLSFFIRGKLTWLDHFWLTYDSSNLIKKDVSQVVIPILGTIRRKSCPLSDHYAIQVNVKI